MALIEDLAPLALRKEYVLRNHHRFAVMKGRAKKPFYGSGLGVFYANYKPLQFCMWQNVLSKTTYKRGTKVKWFPDLEYSEFINDKN